MNRQQIINKIILLSAALNKEGFNDSLEQEQNAQILDEVLQSPFFAQNVALMEKDNVIFYGEQGYVPTRKGWDYLTPKVQTKVVNKMQPKPVEKMTNVEVLTSFVESGFALCHRLPSDRLMQKKAREAYADVADVLTCVTSSFNDTFAPVVEEVIEETEATVEA